MGVPTSIEARPGAVKRSARRPPWRDERNDLVAPGTTIRSFLNAALVATCPIIAWYHRAQGITFPFRSMRTQFLQATGFGSGPAPASGPLAAVQGALPGGGSPAPAQLPTEPERALPLLERLLRTRATLPDDAEPLPDGVAPKYTDVPDLPAGCITAPEGWAGAEIEQAARKAAELMHTRKPAATAAIQRAMELVLPTTANVPQMIEEALDNVDDLELLPETYRKLALARCKRPVLVEGLARSCSAAGAGSDHRCRNARSGGVFLEGHDHKLGWE